MDHIEHYDEGNRALYRRIMRYLKRTKRGPTGFCAEAGVYQSALEPLKKGTIKSQYARKLQIHIDKLDPGGDNSVKAAKGREVQS